ncbi:MAG: TraB/GumN family protein [Desulfobulbaceae bacterium]|nr:MAG: TraB/GumN family protein [Desulfobulbaceae bacterium]
MTNETPHTYGSDVHLIEDSGRQILLVGTAHVSQQSVDLVTQVITEEHPDTVCLELDERRFSALSQEKQWQKLDLKAVIRNKQLSTLLVSLMMASYQKRLGDSLGVSPGAELLAAAQCADQLKIPIRLCDRDIRITLRRAWKSTGFFRKGYLAASLLAGIFDSEEIDEQKLEELKKHDVLTELMSEMGDSMPELKQVLIDERDLYLAEKIKAAPGDKVVAVVGAGHVAGIKRHFPTDNKGELEDITIIPPVSKIWKIVGWLIPLTILTAIGVIGYQKGAAAAGENIQFWILANGIPSTIGAIAALAHPLTILSAFVAAPITSLTPVIGAGYVTAFVQVMVRPPVVREFETVGKDIARIKCWWSNKLLRVFLVFFLTGLGSVIGTYVGGYEIIKSLLTP